MSEYSLINGIKEYKVECLDFSNSGMSEKEIKILNAAIKAFSEKGFNAATTSEIAKNAEVAEGTIFRYFKTKKDILKGITVQMINLMSGRLVLNSIKKILKDAVDKDIREILKEIILDRINLVNAIFPMAKIVLMEALMHEEIRDAIFNNIIKAALDAFKEFYDVMLSKGLVRDDVDHVVLFRSILGNIGIFIAQSKVFDKYIAIDDFDKEIDRVIDVILFGIMKR